MSRPGAVLTVALAIALVGGCGAPAPSASPGTSGSPSTAPATPSTTAGEPYRDPSLPVEARVDDLLARMTDDEKIGQLTLIEKDSIDPGTSGALAIGGVLSGGDGNPTPNDPGAWYAMVDAYQQAALETRLGIPILYGIDAIHGQSHVVGSTFFPHHVGLGATRDRALVEQVGRATALETSATGIRWTFGPVVAVPQDVRWGRTYEAFGEDPASVGDMGAALVRGLQGTDLAAHDAVAATAKHFLGDGGTAWGTSTYPGYMIDRGLTAGDEATLRDLHLPPYRAALAAGARIVMASFSSTAAGKVHGDRRLLTDVLKGELGFTGFVVSDWGGVDEVVPGSYEASVAQAIGAGIDMVMVPHDAVRFGDAVRAGLAGGAIAGERVDDAVRRILRVKVELGLFERPMPPADPVAVGSAQHRQLAARAVAASAVLLRTADGLLPLATGGSAPVLLAGRAADDIGSQLGGWSITWQGATGPVTPGTTLRIALADRLGRSLAWDAGGSFDAGTRAHVGIVVVAEPPYAEGLGDSSTLRLPVADLEVIGRVRPLVDRLVVVIYSGRPVLLGDLDDADAIVAAWLPGTEAQGVARVLLGDEPFAGTTPYTWPRTPDDAPRTGRAACDGAVFPAGYGLASDGSRLGAEACPGA